jgi:hypothetical protein
MIFFSNLFIYLFVLFFFAEIPFRSFSQRRSHITLSPEPTLPRPLRRVGSSRDRRASWLATHRRFKVKAEEEEEEEDNDDDEGMRSLFTYVCFLLDGRLSL